MAFWLPGSANSGSFYCSTDRRNEDEEMNELLRSALGTGPEAEANKLENFLAQHHQRRRRPEGAQLLLGCAFVWGWKGKLINKIFFSFYCRLRFYAFTIPFPRPVNSFLSSGRVSFPFPSLSTPLGIQFQFNSSENSKKNPDYVTTTRGGGRRRRRRTDATHFKLETAAAVHFLRVFL